jgi:hypothetical protein
MNFMFKFQDNRKRTLTLLIVKNYFQAMIHHLQAALIASISIFVDYLFFLIVGATSPLLYQENQPLYIFNNKNKAEMA